VERELVAVITPSANGGQTTAVLWDFSSYDSYSTEQVLRGGLLLHWFLDAGHYRRALGDEVIRRIFGRGDPGFGVQLTSLTIEAHLASIRQQQSHYRETRPDELRRLEQLRALSRAEP
jgi:hypothetical protein